jgi:O-acetyl-ADP-ribose deacetylase (regulator of RNase III)
MIEIVSGDLLLAPEKYIAHQCNCVTQASAGTAKAIFDKYPHANTYAERNTSDTMGTIKILGNGQDERFVINMFAQYYPGKTKYPLSKKDGVETRLKTFHQCLLKIARIPDLESVAFPWKIGCNLGGGVWEHYLGNLTVFANHVEKTGVRVRVYRREEDE